MKQQIKFSDNRRYDWLQQKNTFDVQYESLRSSTKKFHLDPFKSNPRNSIQFRTTQKLTKPSNKVKSEAVTPNKEKEKNEQHPIILKLKTEKKNLQPINSHRCTPNSSSHKLKTESKSIQKLLYHKEYIKQEKTQKKITQVPFVKLLTQKDGKEKQLFGRKLQITNRLNTHKQQTSPNQPRKRNFRNTTTPGLEMQMTDIRKNSTQFQFEQMKKYTVFYSGKRRIHKKQNFTDDKGNPIVVGGDAIAYRYEVLKELGKGAFGRVYKVVDHKKKEQVALKIIKSSPKLISQSKVEIEILEFALEKDVQNKSSIIRMKGSFMFRGHSCITYELLYIDLYEFIKMNSFHPIPKHILIKFAIQILQSLSFFKENCIIHCDIKPQNIMLKEQNKTGIKVIDVGSGCFEKNQIYTYIQSRFYRAPQIILGIKYTPAIDMWSFGCVLAELMKGYPIFPGNDENQQILLFSQVLGKPPKNLVDRGSRGRKFFHENYDLKLNSKSKSLNSNKLSLARILNTHDKKFVDLIRRCLEWDPEKRITPKEALLHDWILDQLPESLRSKHISDVKGEIYFE